MTAFKSSSIFPNHTPNKMMSENILPSFPNDNLLIAERREKLRQLRQKGNAFPNHFKKVHDCAALCAQYADHDKDALAQLATEISIAGRLMSKRLFGKGGFGVLRDATGDLQIFVNQSLIGDDALEDFKHWDLGDIIAVEGTVSRSDKGELTVRAHRIQLLTKALRPLPDKFHGLTDVEQRYRQRYVDLIMNMHTRDIFYKRSLIIRTIRQFFDQKGFLEVETPMMQPIAGGAAARPFVTHHNALDMPFYLRIAPELYLKRIVVGGIEKVYEINRNFRNEGVSTRHNPEFTMMEFYWAYATYEDLMDFTDELMAYLASIVTGNLLVTYQDQTIDFSKPAVRLSVVDAVRHYVKESSDYDLENEEGIRKLADTLGIHYKATDGWGKVLMNIFDEKVEAHLLQPTFITGYPTEISPLARKNDHNPLITDRFEYFIAGRELGNGFSELNDAEDQHERFLQQVAVKDSGDDEAMSYDADFIQALEYGLPPTAGEGIGIDRLVMLFTNAASIREVLLFPHMRSASHGQ